MKRIVVFISLLLAVFFAFAQPPQKMSYQAVVRNANNELVVNQQVSVRVQILKNAPNGLAVYSETHSVTTNANGLMTLQVGTGAPTPGSSFSNIDWANDDFFLRSDIDPNGGSNYTISGTQQLISVPYAFFSGGSDYNQLINRPADGVNNGDIAYWNANDGQWHILPIGNAGDVLTVGTNGFPQWRPNSGGSGSGATTPTPPTIITDSVFNITGRTASVAAHITDPGSTAITASGVCWSMSPYPSIGNNATTDGMSIGAFNSQISNLVSGTVFYARAYATNSAGTSYGNVIQFTTPLHCGNVTDYDGNVYNTIYIGAQCWMKENLRTTHYANGAAIRVQNDVLNNGNNGLIMPLPNRQFCYYYNDDPNNAAIYGMLYSWSAVMNGAGSSNNAPSGIQGVCPSGWHVPSDNEWCELENYLEPGINVNCNILDNYHGSFVKQMTLPQYWTSYGSNSFAPGYHNIDATGFNTSGFSAVPGGYLYSYYSSNNSNYAYNDIHFSGLGTNAYFWSCTKDNNNYILYRYINYAQSGMYVTSTTTSSNSGYNHYAMSVRCVKN